MYTAVLFDMDGVLIDSEPGYNRADAVWFEELGIPFGKREIAAITGANDIVIGRMMKQWHPHLPYTAEELAAQYADNLFVSLSRDVTALIDGADAWLPALRKHGVRLGLGSSSTRRMVSYIAEKFYLDRRMECIVTGDDVPLGKPHPDIYLRCAELLRVAPAECLVIEDSINGILAAHAAGMKVAAFTGTNRHNLNLGEADFSFGAFDADAFQTLLGVAM